MDGKSSGQGGWATQLEVPVYPLGKGLFIMERFPRIGNGKRYKAESGKFQCSWRKMEIADKTVLSVVLVAVKVGFVSVRFAMGDCLVVMLQQVVQFFQGHCLKENNRQ